MAILVAASGGCQTERITSDGRPLPPKPRPVAAAPATAEVSRMVFMVGSKPEDTNRSGYPDLVRATVALFASTHPTSMHQDGTFVFQLFSDDRSRDPGGGPMAEWRMEGEDVQRAQARAQWGPCYQFRLSLAEKGVEIQRLASAHLRATFIPANGAAPVHSDGVRSIQIGRR